MKNSPLAFPAERYRCLLSPVRTLTQSTPWKTLGGIAPGSLVEHSTLVSASRHSPSTHRFVLGRKLSFPPLLDSLFHFARDYLHDPNQATIPLPTDPLEARPEEAMRNCHTDSHCSGAQLRPASRYSDMSS